MPGIGENGTCGQGVIMVEVFETKRQKGLRETYLYNLKLQV